MKDKEGAWDDVTSKLKAELKKRENELKEEAKKWKAIGGVPAWEEIAKLIGGNDGAVFLKTVKDWNGIK